MYLSRVFLDDKRRQTMQALASPQMLHGAVEQSFHGDRQRNLWRIDWLNGKCNLLVLSSQKPDFHNLLEQFGVQSNRQWETKSYDPLLARLGAGQKWRFRLCANPVHSSFKEKDKKTGRGKIYAHVTQEQQRQWLLDRAKTCGFELKESDFDVIHRQWFKFIKNRNAKHNVTLRTATFEGVLSITDLEIFRKALLNGIGRAKAYGCGLLTIAGCREDSNA